MASAIVYIDEIQLKIERPNRKLDMKFVGATDDLDIYAGSMRSRIGFDGRIAFVNRESGLLHTARIQGERPPPKKSMNMRKSIHTAVLDALKAFSGFSFSDDPTKIVIDQIATGELRDVILKEESNQVSVYANVYDKDEGVSNITTVFEVKKLSVPMGKENLSPTRAKCIDRQVSEEVKVE